MKLVCGLLLALAVGCVRSTVPGQVLAESADGALCASAEARVQAVPGGFDLQEGAGCRFCPHRATVRFTDAPPDLSADRYLVGSKLVATHVEEVGCGASACEYRFTAWWREGGRWVVVEQVDGETDALFGAGAPSKLAWAVVQARCEGG